LSTLRFQLIHPTFDPGNRSHFSFGERVRNRALKALETTGKVLPASAFFSKARVSLLFVSQLAAM